MKRTRPACLRIPGAAILVGWFSCWVAWAGAPAPAEGPRAAEVRILESQGSVELSPAGAATWVLTQSNQVLRAGDRLRTGPNSRVTLRWSDQSVVPFSALTEIEILPPHQPEAQSGLRLIKGILSFFHRDKPGRIRVITRGAVAGVEGTEFVVEVATVNNTEQTTLSVIDGKVQFTNEHGALVLTNLQRAVAEVGKKPLLTAGFIANNVLQWCFYYPAVLDLRELPLTPEEQAVLVDSIAAYREGDLLAALAKYPEGRPPSSDAERVYYAALLLSVGQVDKTQEILAALPAGDPSDRLQRLATALHQLIAAVKRESDPSTLNPQLSTEFLAASYYEQSRAVRETSLRGALALARRAATNSPEFGFAWARVAELEFSFGRTSRALETLDKALALTPRNAQALALRGFLLAGQNKTREAIDWFNQAIAVDAALGNAWLGRGLCRIRRGDRQGGREDLLVAAALEPQRAVLRSYLGKAYADVGDTERATHELDLAKRLDPEDPTGWLYSALRLQQENRINEAVRDLEKSALLNDNRHVYRSELLLDQDRAVSSAYLANIYQDAGMTDVSVREAGRAVSYDYANYSAHLFLANSYDDLRDPNRINLRYETPAESEYLIANLLAPVGAGVLAQSVSHQDYSKLFERDRLGVSSTTEYLSRGAWAEQGAQFGTFGNSSYLFEGLYRWDPGQRPNNDFEETDLRLHLKQQITSKDSVYLRVGYYNAEGGDVIQYYDQSSAYPSLRTEETQDGSLVAGYHREWSPGNHTLFVFGWLPDRYAVDNPAQVGLFVARVDQTNGIEYAEAMTTSEKYRSTLALYSGELQQIWQQADHNVTVGMRYQAGDIHTSNLQTDPSFDVIAFFPPPPQPAAQQDFTTGFDRLSFYGYYRWQVVEPLQLTVGLAYDTMTFPEDFRSPPILDTEESVDQLSPKAGLIWTPGRNTTVRFAYTRSLGGASLDQSFQIEPTQVAGFNQMYRSIIPESVGGANAGAEFQTFNAAFEQRFKTGTYVSVSGQILGSEVSRTLGNFLFDPDAFATPGSMSEHLDYEEKSLLVTFDQLLGQRWSLGVRYWLSDADLEDNFPGMVNGAVFRDGFRGSQHLEATLQQLSLHAIYNHPSGLFGRLEALWTKQSNRGYGFVTPGDPSDPYDPGNSAPNIPGDEFWQLNAFVGYRFPRRKVEVTVGLLNITGEDYQLNPLTLYNELPRERTFAARLRFNF